MMKYRAISILAFIVFLSGCVPLQVNNYFRPMAEGGALRQTFCGGSVGPFDRIDFDNNNVRIGVRVDQYNNDLYVSLYCWVPEGKTLIIKDKKIMIQLNKEKREVALYHEEGLSWNKNEPFIIIGQDLPNPSIFLKEKLKKQHKFNAKLPALEINSLSITLPNFIINDQNVVLPDIQFSKDRNIEFFVPINC